MKKISILLVCIMAVIFGAQSASAQSGRIRQVTSVHDVQQNGEMGMSIKVWFEVSGMLNEQGVCAAYFHFSNGQELEDFNEAYYSIDGKVCTYDFFTSPYENTTYKEFILFIPYNEFHLSSGVHNFYYTVTVFDNNYRALARSEKVGIKFTKP